MFASKENAEQSGLAAEKTVALLLVCIGAVGCHAAAYHHGKVDLWVNRLVLVLCVARPSTAIEI